MGKARPATHCCPVQVPLPPKCTCSRRGWFPAGWQRPPGAPVPSSLPEDSLAETGARPTCLWGPLLPHVSPGLPVRRPENCPSEWTTTASLGSHLPESLPGTPHISDACSHGGRLPLDWDGSGFHPGESTGFGALFGPEACEPFWPWVVRDALPSVV